MFMKMIKEVKKYISNYSKRKRIGLLYEKYKEYTMIPPSTYLKNLSLVEKFRRVEGSIVECGVWRGGMIAGISELLGKDRNYFLFDSFEGLPPVKEIDGQAARDWQNDKDSPHYLDNCRAEQGFADEAMKKSGAVNYQLIKGWFVDTLPTFPNDEKIACLRLDGDWYDSTMECLTNLYPKVVSGGVIIIDDYYVWDGCSRAVHDYMSRNNLAVRIRQFQDSLAYIVK